MADFDGRDGLLTELIRDAYHELADATVAAVAAATRTLRAFLEPLAELSQATGAYPELERQLAAGLADRDPDAAWSGASLRLGVIGWTRMHGMVSLEVEGHFDPMGFDPGLLFEAEIEELIQAASAGPPGR